MSQRLPPCDSAVPARSRDGFTMVEVMIALALMGLTLIVTMKGNANNLLHTQEAHLIGVSTDLARGKMYDIEEKLQKDGFSDTAQTTNGDFSEEGWPAVTWEANVEPVELPSFNALNALAQDKAKDTQAARAAALAGGNPLETKAASKAPTLAGQAEDKCAPPAAEGSFSDSTLGGMLGMMGMGAGGGGADAATAGGASFIQSQYQMFQQILKLSIRKVTLTVGYTLNGTKRDFRIVAYFTDPAGLTKGMGMLGAAAADDGAAASSGAARSPTSGASSGAGTRGGAR